MEMMLRKGRKWDKWIFLGAAVGVVVFGCGPKYLAHSVWFQVSGSEGSLKYLAREARIIGAQSRSGFCGVGREDATKAWLALIGLAHTDSEVLRRVLVSDSNPKMRATLAKAIGQAENGWYRPSLEKMALGDPDRLTRAIACDALLEIGDKRSMPVLRLAARDASREVQAIALEALLKLGKDESVVKGLQLLAKGDPFEEFQAVLDRRPMMDSDAVRDLMWDFQAGHGVAKRALEAER